MRDKIPVTLLGDPGRCILPAMKVRDLADEPWILPLTRESCWGGFFHETIEKAARAITAGDKRDWACAFLNEELKRVAVLRRRFSYDEWVSRTADLRAIVQRELGSGKVTPPPHERESGRVRRIGYEVTLMSERYPLVGRADHIATAGKGVYSITDFKSGWVFENDGSVLRTLRMQLLAYSMIFREQDSNSKVTILISTPEKIVPLPQFSTDDEEVRAEIERVQAKAPLGGSIEADAIATPGPSCSFCPLRPSCGPYLKIAPSWWAGPTDHRRPFDVWGRIISVSSGGGESPTSVNIEDPTGALRTLKNMDKNFPVQVGEEISCFDLWAHPVRESQSRWLQPRVFFAGPQYPTGIKECTHSFFLNK